MSNVYQLISDKHYFSDSLVIQIPPPYCLISVSVWGTAPSYDQYSMVTTVQYCSVALQYVSSTLRYSRARLAISLGRFYHTIANSARMSTIAGI